MNERQPITAAERSLTARSLLTQTVETSVLPVERFKGDPKGEAVDIRTIGENVAVLREVGDRFEAAFYDGKGKVTKIPLDISNKDLAGATTKDYLHVQDTFKSDQYADGPTELLNKLGYSNQVATKILERFRSEAKKRYGTDSYLDRKTVNNGEEFLLTAGNWRLEKRRDASGQEVFMFNSKDLHIVLNPADRSFTVVEKQTYDTLADVENVLPNGLKLKKETTIFGVTDEQGKIYTNYTGEDPIVDPSNTDNLYFINTGRIYKLDLKGVTNRTTRPVVEAQIKVDDPKEIEFDPNGNFLIIRSGNGKLTLVDKETGEEAKTIDQVRGPFKVDGQGDILYVDTQGRLREIQTNFQAIPNGGDEAAIKRREEQLRQMQERFANLELKKVEKSKTGQVTEQDVANTLRESISRQVSKQITTSTKPEDIEDILDRLNGLKGDPANQAYGEVIDEFVGQARDKLSGIRTTEFSGQLGVYQKALDEVKSVGDTIGLDEQFAKLLELRQKIDVTDPVKRREIEQRLRTLQAKKDTLNNQYQGELIEAARQALPQLEQLIKEVGSPQELAYFSTSTQAQQFEMILANIRDPQARKDLRDRFNQVRTEQRSKLEAKGKELAEQDRQRWAQVVEEARDDLANLRTQIEQTSDTREIDRFGKNPLVTAWRAKLFGLPPELREIEEKKLEIILGARKKDMEHRKELGAVGEAGELKFGKASFPVYKEPPRIWKPKLIPTNGEFSQWADLVFEDSLGRVFNPGGEKRIVAEADINSERTKMLIDRYRKEADEHFQGMKRKVPEFDEHWKITDYHMEKLEEVVEALNLQLDNHRGILILQGEAGTGKNVLADMLANLSNREVVQIACNENSVKEDLTYEWKYNPEKGTYEIPSRLITGMQTPGTIILFDEINALKPGVAKMMNSLFDYHRRLFMPGGEQQQEVIADPTVIFVGTMNPQNYAGVNRLSPEVKSRARVIDVDYPPFDKDAEGKPLMKNGRQFWRSDEAEMLAGYMEKLGDLKQKELRQCWNYVINKDTSNGADRILQTDPAIESDIRRVYDVVRTANRLRDMYAAYQTGDSNEPMDFPTSLREVTDIVMEMNHRQGVKPMIKRVIIPKIDDRRQKRLVEQTIDAVLPT